MTYLHGVATTRPADRLDPGLDVLEVPAGTWAVLRTEGPQPAALQQAWAATATCELWLPVEPG